MTSIPLIELLSYEMQEYYGRGVPGLYLIHIGVGLH